MASLKDYLQLCRASAVFTALADICLGHCLVHKSFLPPKPFVGLLIASAGLYLGGMVWNDIFDREIDARERPQRPLPSGRISKRNAVTFGVFLIGTGLAGAAFAGQTSLLVGLILAACIFAYDGYLKPTPLGPVAMGSCRTLNVLLGASAGASSLADVFAMPQLYVALAMGVYIAGVTLFAKDEAEKSRRSRLWQGAVVVNLGLLLLAAWPIGWVNRAGWAMPLGEVSTMSGVALVAMILLTVNRRMLSAIRTPNPAHVQGAVKVLLLTVIILDASLIHYWAGPDGSTWSFATVALLGPAVWFGRWLWMT